MLMHKLSAIIQIRDGNSDAFQGFLDIWRKFIKFWDTLHPQKKVLNINLIF